MVVPSPHFPYFKNEGKSQIKRQVKQKLMESYNLNIRYYNANIKVLNVYTF